MDILIKNMEMPKKGHCTIVAVFSDGSVDYRDREEMAYHRTTAVALPEHGELISRGGALFQLQAEALGISPNDKDFEGIKKGLLIARKIIIEAPVIVEASK